jgi:starch phosphorylase
MQEASGTSGMKAGMNGVLHLSVPDGWWHEGYNDGNGWAIGDDTIKSSPEEEDRSDAAALYDILEQKVIPLYYNRDRSNLPPGWIAMMKKSISSITPAFSARRMLKDYGTKMYLPALKNLAQSRK